MSLDKQKNRLAREAIVFRIIWMLLFFLVWQVAVPLLCLVVIAQLVFRLFYGAPHQNLMSFGDSISQYLLQIGRFEVFSTDDKPWPIADWPQANPADGESAYQKQTKSDAAE